MGIQYQPCMFGDLMRKAEVEQEAAKRNKHMGKHQARTHTWKVLWDSTHGWHLELKHKGDFS